MPDSLSAIVPPSTDPTALFEFFRGTYATELLTAAVAHFDLFPRLEHQPLSFSQLRLELGLAERPAHVLFTALAAFGLLDRSGNELCLTDLAREHLLPGCNFSVNDYFSLAAQSPGVLAMVKRLRSNQPTDADNVHRGAAFIYREGIDSAMESERSARFLTLALAGRARNVAPLLAERASLADVAHLLDVGGGTGIYSIALLQKYPHLSATVWDRPEVLKVTAELAEAYGVGNRLTCLSGDMFADPLPGGADAILLSNVLHDWDVPENRLLLNRCAQALPTGGRLLIHDVFLNDDLSGPLPVALYSAALFSLTLGRAYSRGEYHLWLQEAGMVATDEVLPTLIHCGLMTAFKPPSPAEELNRVELNRRKTRG